jgi:hypothetical protein
VGWLPEQFIVGIGPDPGITALWVNDLQEMALGNFA